MGFRGINVDQLMSSSLQMEEINSVLILAICVKPFLLSLPLHPFMFQKHRRTFSENGSSC